VCTKNFEFFLNNFTLDLYFKQLLHKEAVYSKVQPFKTRESRLSPGGFGFCVAAGRNNTTGAFPQLVGVLKNRLIANQTEW